MSSSDPLPGQLVVRSPGATLDVLNPWGQPLNGGGAIGELSLEVPPGPYQVSARIAGTENTQLVVVRPGATTQVDVVRIEDTENTRLVVVRPGATTQVDVVPVAFDAAAPVVGTRTANESHGMLAAILTGTTTEERTTVPPSRSCSLVLILRGLRGRVMAPLPNTDAPFELFDQRGRPVQLPAPTPDPQGYGRAVGWAVPLPPGGYRLRWAGPSEQPVEHAVWLSPGWQTLLFVPQDARGPSLPEMSIHLLRAGSSWDRWSTGWLAAETALAALRGTTASAIDPRSADFVTDADNPMLALLTLHILGRAREAGVLGDDNQGWTERAAGGIRQLRRSLGRHPDVAALAEQWPRGSAGRRPARVPATPWPPLLAASLDLLLDADARPPGVIPAGSLTEAVSGQRYANSPWLLWDPEGLPLEPQPRQPPRSRARPQRYPGMREGLGEGLSGGGPTDLDVVEVSKFTEPPAAEPRPTTTLPTSVAVERVEDLVRGVAQVLQLPPAQAAQRLGVPEIARRLGMTRRLVESCIDFTITAEKAREQAEAASSLRRSTARDQEAPADLPGAAGELSPDRITDIVESRTSATQGGSTDFPARLDELQQRAAEAKASAQAAVSESREQLRQRIDQAKVDVDLAAKDARQDAQAAAASARSKWAQMKADAAAKMEDVKAKIDRRTRQLDAKAAATDADWAEAEAADALDFAEWAVDNAQLAMLDAIDARAYADELAKRWSPAGW
jgi:hypothetical protein